MKTKIKTLIAAVLAICLILTGCAFDSNRTPAPSAKSTGTTTPEATKTESSKTNPAEPLMLETPAGAVLVGKIKKDADGWYFEPEQPLNIKLTCYLDFTPSYNNLTRIEMFENSVDGTSKELFLYDTVTVTGMLQNYRGNMDSLYLYPCRIEHGKTVVGSHAMPELDYPAEEPPSYDPSVPLPDGMQPIIENGYYVYNPYILTVNTLEGMGNDFAAFYKGFVDAFLSYQTSCPCPSKNYAEMFSSVMFYEFPLFVADGEFDLQSGYDEKTQTMNWSYKSKSKAEHDKLISDFTAVANSFLKSVKATDSEQLRAQAIYHAFCPRMTYDYEVLESRERVEAYYAYTLNRGVCVTFSCAMMQLFAQVGIKATIVSGNVAASGDGHAWNIVTIDGENYFCDSTYELSYNSGNAFVYFGMTMEDRLNDGSGFSVDKMYVGGINTKPASEVTLAKRTLRIK